MDNSCGISGGGGGGGGGGGTVARSRQPSYKLAGFKFACVFKFVRLYIALSGPATYITGEEPNGHTSSD